MKYGIDVFLDSKKWKEIQKKKFAILCNDASLNGTFKWTPDLLKHDNLKCLFGPQHGLATSVQDNMVETKHDVHPLLKIPVYSLYSETRTPTDEMLQDLDVIIVDLQDVGTRVYTYIWTLFLLMQKVENKDIEIHILDRPNPVGRMVEGPGIECPYYSFVGLIDIPFRHGLTFAEMGLFFQKNHFPGCHLTYTLMEDWDGTKTIFDDPRSWVHPSPNLSSKTSSFTFVSTVLFEGTNMSEGRGTTKALEVIGHPDLCPFAFMEEVKKWLNHFNCVGAHLRPIFFRPMFQKHGEKNCGGVQIHITDEKVFNGWYWGQLLLRVSRICLGEKFKWTGPPYEYDHIHLPIDLIQGTNKVRKWHEEYSEIEQLQKIEGINREEFLVGRTFLYE